ncbi:MAG: hypothetical protein RL660_1393 [Bacteroidota bacterium]|jgi:hypothetical protein
MKLKTQLILLFLLFVQVAQANMSSPIWEGTMTGSAFTSKNIDILSEFILIKIGKDYKTAKFTVEYTIQSPLTGRQIPLLFCAKDYKDSFFVWVDNNRVTIQEIPKKYSHYDNSTFSGFSGLTDEVTIYWSKNPGFTYKLHDLKYFETDIAKGVHTVRVEYVANVWTDISDWIKKYSFRYSLTPAKFWKSFGNLTVALEQEGTIRQLSTNIGEPIEKTFQAKNSWKFTKLPDEYIEFSYAPKADNLTKALIAIQPFGLSIIAGVLLFVLHLFLSFRYRRQFVNKKYSPVVIIGSLLIPFLILLSYIYSYDFIDNVIGEEAGRYHGYISLAILFYPLLLALYWTIVWLLDRHQKRKLINEKGSR